MHYLRKADERGITRTGWLDSRHTFSFGSYYDPDHMGFSDLRVINDDTVAPGGGFMKHPHADMEIISIVIEGALRHEDSMGNGSVIYPGDVQKMSAGTGIEHSEVNESRSKPVHFLQIWITPDQKGLVPTYAQEHFSDEQLMNQLCLVVSSDVKKGIIPIRQDMKLYETKLSADKIVKLDMKAERAYWIQMISGSIWAHKRDLKAGDGLAVWDETGIMEIKGLAPESHFIVFDLAK